MPSPPRTEMQFDYRSKARAHVQTARELLNSNDAREAEYACLELRMAIEALTYDVFRQYSFEVPSEAMDKWTPKKVLEELLHIYPDVDKTTSIRIGFPDSPGIPLTSSTSAKAIDFQQSGGQNAQRPRPFPTPTDIETTAEFKPELDNRRARQGKRSYDRT
jgi:hypothetical protein